MADIGSLIVSVGAIIEVWGWRNTGSRGERKVWTVKRETL
jgi:hypothetical protein